MRRRRRKQKRYLSIALIVIALVLIVACVGVYVVKNNSDSQIASNEMEVDQVNETEEVTATDNIENTTSADSSNSDVYESLLAGTGKMSFSYYMDNVFKDSEYLSYEDELFKALSATEYTLPDLIKEMNKIFNDDENYFMSGEVTNVAYSYLDCGNDGVKELAIKLSCPLVDEESTLTMIIKEMSGVPQLVFAFPEWSRSYTSINEYGYITGGGSSGATIHGGTVELIDANGQHKYGYYEEEQGDFDMFAEFEDHTDYDLSTIDGNLIVLSLRLNPSSENDYKPNYYTYLVYDENYEEIDVPNLYTDSPYKQITDCMTNIDFITYDEFEKVKKDKEIEIGATDEIKNGKELEFKDIKF